MKSFSLKENLKQKKKSNFSFSNILGTGKLKKDDAIKEVMQSVTKNLDKNQENIVNKVYNDFYDLENNKFWLQQQNFRDYNALKTPA